MSTTAPSIVIPVEDVKEWRGQDVLGADGAKLGKLDEVYYDTETDVPTFVAVKSGLVGKHLTLVPLSDATAGRQYLRVTTDKDRFKGAPSFETDVELTAEGERATYEYYGMSYRPAGEGARRLARH